MEWLVTKNSKPVKLKQLPIYDMAQLRGGIIEQCSKNLRPVSFFGVKEKEDCRVFCVLADDENSRLLCASAEIRKPAYGAITTEVPAFHIFERELFEEFGIEPVGHPWLKPVRSPFYNHDKNIKFEKDYPFFKMEGSEVHEVAVGPVHAGIIEPGHFRFMCQGEDVYHLEIQLGYQHRGVEKLMEKISMQKGMLLAESIAGDTVIGHGMTYCGAIEALTGCETTRRAASIRGIALELERVAIHIGDLSAIASDIAYQIGSVVFGALRTLVINTTLEICGNRFGRGLIRPGGVVYDIFPKTAELIKKNLTKVKNEAGHMAEIMFNSASVLSRLQETGIVTAKEAQEIGLVGFAARASGVHLDVRADHSHGIYLESPVYKKIMTTGDVFARSYVRYMEIMQSIEYILEQLENLPQDGLMKEVKKIQPDSFVVSLTEGWRGEIVHAALTDRSGVVVRYKIKDPSFNNWYGLALAVRGEGISDFPLCNKSFSLSYCGNDL